MLTGTFDDTSWQAKDGGEGGIRTQIPLNFQHVTTPHKDYPSQLFQYLTVLFQNLTGTFTDSLKLFFEAI